MNLYKYIIFIATIFTLVTHVSYSQEITNMGDQPEVLSDNVVDETSEIPPIQHDIDILSETETPPLGHTETQPLISTNENIVETTEDIIFEKDVLTERNLSKKIILDKEAIHSCQSSDFSVSLHGNGSIRAYINLHKNPRSNIESLEVGSLPNGIDVTIEDSYFKSVTPSELSVPISISKQPGAQTGSFNILIIYNIKIAEKVSSTVCQINIINDEQ